MGESGRADLSLRARQHRRAVRAARGRSRPGDSMSVETELGRAALHRAPAPGSTGPPLRLRPVVSQGGGLRPLRLGGASALSCRRVLRRVRHLPGGSRRARGSGHRRHRRSGVRRPRLGAGQPQPARDRSTTSATTTAPSTPLGRRCDGAAAGRKTIRWYAEDVHHFAMSLNPDYRYEGGRYGNVAVHVLYQPGDESTWGGGVAVERTADRAGLAGPALRAVRLAADHQRAPDRGRRHRVPHDDP